MNGHMHAAGHLPIVDVVEGFMLVHFLACVFHHNCLRNIVRCCEVVHKYDNNYYDMMQFSTTDHHEYY